MVLMCDLQSEVVKCFCCSLFSLEANPFALLLKGIKQNSRPTILSEYLKILLGLGKYKELLRRVRVCYQHIAQIQDSSVLGTLRDVTEWNG
jgi:hypothetical protein